MVKFKRVEALLAAGAQVNATTEGDYCALMYAINAEDDPIDFVRILLDAGANPHALTRSGRTLLHVIVHADGQADAEVVNLLLALGLDINQRDYRGETVLGAAIEDSTPEKVKLILNAGADPNLSSNTHRCTGRTCELIESLPIFIAIHSTHPDECVEALLSAGANLQVHDEQGRTPLEAARNRLRRLEGRKQDLFTREALSHAERVVRLLEIALESRQ